MTNDISVEAKTAPGFKPSDLSGIEKTAILLLSLSESDAASILKHLEPKQVQKVGMAMAAMQDFG
ncbi:flagellar motor switch protein FliG, partial [Shewanella sp. 0m-11]